MKKFSPCLVKMSRTAYYTEQNGKVIRRTISSGDDWITFVQHQKLWMVFQRGLQESRSDYLIGKLWFSDERLVMSMVMFRKAKVGEVVSKRIL